MKPIALLFAVFGLALAGSLQDPVPAPEFVKGEVVRRPGIAPRPTKDQCPEGKLLGCRDCHSVMACDATQALVNVARCPASTPYCVEGKCSPDPTMDCNPAIQQVNCPAPKKIFPHPNRCDSYFYCDENLVATDFVCPEEYFFTPELDVCARGNRAIECASVDCADVANHGKLFAYPMKKSLFVFCADRPTLFECPTDHYFDEKAESCAFMCPGEGRFRHPYSIQKFYWCEQDGHHLIPHTIVCPDTKFFNHELGFCMRFDEIFFTCPTIGRFPHPVEDNKFYLCNMAEDGRLHGALIVCEDDLRFDRELKVCVRPEETPFSCPSEGIHAHPVNDDKYYLCIVNDEGFFIPHLVECDPDHIFSQFHQTCIHVDPDFFNCPQTGRFPHPQDAKKFFSCSLNEEGRIVHTLLTCLDDQHFDNSLKVCIRNDEKFFECPAIGDFHHPADDQKFWRCEVNADGYLIASLLTCTSDSFFDRAIATCVRNVEREFECIMEGRFRDVKSENHYYICERLRGGLIVRHVECPGGLAFDPRSGVCGIIF